MTEPKLLGDRLGALARRGLVIGLIGLAGSVIAFLLAPDALLRGWLMAWLLFFGFAAGAVPLVMIHHLTGGQWGIPSRPLLEAAGRTLPVAAVGFLPVALGIDRLYRWARVGTTDPHVAKIRAWLNEPAFLARSVLYLLIFSALGLFFTGSGRGRRRLAGPGLIVYGLTVTAAAIDWGMSLDAHFYSTMYGGLYIASQSLGGWAVILAVLFAAGPAGLSPELDAKRMRDLGNLLLMLTMVWAYFAFSQYLIIWSGDLAEEIPFYLHRAGPGWIWISWGLILFAFAVPFLVLLFRRSKENARALGLLAIGVVVMRAVDVYWLLGPAFHESGPRPGLPFLAALAAVGGLWFALFGRSARGRDLVLRDEDLPRMERHG